MTERQLQFRVGLFVILSGGAIAGMVFYFGEIAQMWEPRYPLVVHFENAPGVFPGTPVRRNGISIGKVQEVVFDEHRGGVLTLLSIDGKHRLRKDAKPRIVRSILGDSSIDFAPGLAQEFFVEGDRIDGIAPPEPMEIVARMEENVTTSLVSFERTSAEWRKVGEQLNHLMDTNQGQLEEVIVRTSKSLEEFSLAMRKTQETLTNANSILADAESQQALKQALTALPQLVEDTRGAIASVRTAVATADKNLANLENATQPLAKRTASIVLRLDNTLANLEAVSHDVNVLTSLAAQENGTLRKFATDPTLYQNLNHTAEMLAVLMRNIEPILHDARIFSDRVARHPEILGISGALAPSSGVKQNSIQQTNFEQPSAAPNAKPTPQRTVNRPNAYGRN